MCAFMLNYETVTIVGVGLIGGGIAKKLRKYFPHLRILGVEKKIAHIKDALKLEMIDSFISLDEAIMNSQLIILATPVDVILTELPFILDKVDDQIVFDTGSVKETICISISGHAKRGRYVATHPMWGSEKSGPIHSDLVSFGLGNVAVICNEDQSDRDALLIVKSIYESFGVGVLCMPAELHDLHIAYVSQLSRLISYCFANTVLNRSNLENNIFALASSGFATTSRLAKGYSDLWAPVFDQNRTNLTHVLDEYIIELTKFRSFIANSDRAAIDSLIAQANLINNIGC